MYFIAYHLKGCNLKALTIYSLICLVAVLLTAAFIHPFWLTLYTCGVLVLFEVALSFDNAIVNANILQHLSPFWQRIFLTWGIVIAVFVVRFCLPVLLVYFASNYSMAKVLHVVFHNPNQYQHLLQQAMPIISGFGGGFLWMLFIGFLAHAAKTKSYWFKWLEQFKLWHKLWWQILAMLIVGVAAAWLSHDIALFWAYIIGAVLQWGISLLRGNNQNAKLGRMLLKAGLLGFIYLELIDASFSLDSVLGAFAITDDIIIIMVGLGCGALVIRALTVQMVKHGTLQKWRYLEHGAHYAIGALALILLAKNLVHVPEWLAGTASLVIILAAVIHSYLRGVNKHA